MIETVIWLVILGDNNVELFDARTMETCIALQSLIDTKSWCISGMRD